MSERTSQLRLQQREVTDDVAECPRCEARLPHHTISEAWVEVEVGEGWVAAYRIVPQRGRPAIGEVRLFPDEPKRDAGHWSERPSVVPEWGLPGTLFGRLRLADALKKFDELVADADEKTEGYFSDQVLQRFDLQRGDQPAVPRPGRGGRDDYFYAVWAAAYVDLLQRGDQTPVKSLAQTPPIAFEGTSLPLSPHTVRGILAEARARQLLSAGPQGRAGGELSQSAKELLSESS